METDAIVAGLQGERARLVGQLDDLGVTEEGELRTDQDFGDGFADAASATAGRAERLGIAENLVELLRNVDRALSKVEQGTYGICERCGKTIDPDRMEYRPTSRYCVECKALR